MKKILLVVVIVLMAQISHARYSDGTFQSFELATEAQLKVSTPTVVGMPFYDTTNKAVVITTGTVTSFDYGQVNIGTMTPVGW